MASQHPTRMERLTTRGGKEVWLQQLERPFKFKPPFPARRYVAIVFSNDRPSQIPSARPLPCTVFFGLPLRRLCWPRLRCLGAGTQHFMYREHQDYHPSDDAFTLTTTHEGESVEDVMVYGLTNTISGSHEFDRFLVLFVGPRAGLGGEVKKAIKSTWHQKDAG